MKSSIKLIAVMPLLTIAAVGGSVAMTSAASAQTSFNAKITGNITPHALCPDGVFVCGTAKIGGFVALAEYRLFISSITPPTRPCGNLTAGADYVGTATFTLPDNSKLTLDEKGTFCIPGSSFPTGGISFGNPRTFTGSWTVQSARGEFSGTSGSGTDTGLTAGGVFHVAYVAGN